jgi:hypothetical protein
VSIAIADRFDGSDQNDLAGCRFFGFSEIKWAIANFNRAAFPGRARPEILDFAGYLHLKCSIEALWRIFSRLNIAPEAVPLRQALAGGVTAFQTMNELPKGPCDLFTMRHIWNASLPLEADLGGICRLVGLQFPFPQQPLFSKTLAKLSLQGLGDARAVQGVVNRIIGQLPDTSSAGEWLIKEAEQSAERQGQGLKEAAKAAGAISQKVKEIEATIVESSQKMGGSARRFRDVTESLDRMITRHASMVRDMGVVQTRMDRERRGNQVLLVLVCILSIILAVRVY